MDSVETILSYMKIYGEDTTIQKNQTKHRMKLVKQFGIRPGESVLEIGCGQGDTTAVLASAVGPSGHIHAVDIASTDYGSPITLGEAAEHLEKSALGKRIRFDFETDILDSGFKGHYDTAVLSHSLLYFSSRQQLEAVFRKAAQLADKICVAEWDMLPFSPSQMTHSQAILVQSLFTQYQQTTGNIQLFLTKEEVATLLQHTGWDVITQDTVSAMDLLDGEWEVDYTEELMGQLEAMPKEVLPVFETLQKWLDVLNRQHGVETCNSFVYTAVKRLD